MEQVSQDNIFEFGIKDDTQYELNGLSRWLQINAIIAFISLAISIITTVITFAKYVSIFGIGWAFKSTEMIKLGISIIISLVLNILLIQSSANIKKGLLMTDQGHLNLGLSKLATYFKITGILIIALLFILVLAFFFALLRLF
jgi:hypothetical protein